VKITNAEKLIISMLADLHEKLGIDPENAKFINSVIHADQAWAIPWKFHGLFGDQAERAPDEVYEVLNFLDMWAILEEGVAALSPEAKASLTSTWKGSTTFTGFDGNNEPKEMSIAYCFVHKLNSFSRFADRDLNSHMPRLEKYRAMYKVFEPLRVNVGPGRPLGKEELLQVFLA